jgi:transcription termination factor NusB
MDDQTVQSSDAVQSDGDVLDSAVETNQPEQITSDQVTHSKEDPSSKSDYSESEKKEIESFMTKLKLPKEVTYFQDKSGELKFIVPINGQKFIASPEDVFKGFNLNQAGYQKLSEAKQMIKETENYFQSLKQNPKQIWELAQGLGLNPLELSQQLLEEHVRDAEMTPAERALRKKEAEAEEYRRRLEAYEKEQEQTKISRAVEVEREKYDKQLVEAMQKHGFNKLSSNGKSVVLASAVQKLMTALEANHELSVNDAIYLAKQEWQESIPAVFDEIPDHLLLESLPPKFVSRIQKLIVERHTKGIKGIPTASSNSPIGGEVTLESLGHTNPQKSRKKMDIHDYFSNLR